MSSLKAWHEIPIAGIPFVKSEEYRSGDWRTFTPKIDPEKCIKCGFCWIYCPDSSIIWDGETVPTVDLKHCKGCGVCAEECPVKAIEMVR